MALRFISTMERPGFPLASRWPGEKISHPAIQRSRNCDWNLRFLPSLATASSCAIRRNAAPPPAALSSTFRRVASNSEKRKQREFLAARAKSPADPVVAVRSELRRDGAKEHVDLLLRSNFAAQEIAAAIDRLVAAKELVVQGDIVADANWWTTLRQRAAAAIEREHEKNPQLPGLDLADLRAELENVSSKIFDALIVDLGRNGYAKIGNFIKRTEHRAALPSNLTAPAEKIRRLVSEKPFDPPARKQIAPDAQSRQALSFLIKQGEIIDLGLDLVLSAEAFDNMKAVVIAFISSKGSATVSELRQELQTSRRIMVPFLETLDAQKVTRRVGDKRLLA